MTLGEKIRKGLEDGWTWEVDISKDCPQGEIILTKGSNVIEVCTEEARSYVIQGIERQIEILKSPLYKALT